MKDVERGNRGPQLVLSRANEEFIEYLFRQEVPEMESGAVEIKGIACAVPENKKYTMRLSGVSLEDFEKFATTLQSYRRK